MDSLRNMGEFVGIPQNSSQVARYFESRTTTLSLVNLLLTKKERPASMRAIIQILQNLTPLTLEAQVTGDRSGEDAIISKIRVNASGGIPWFTFIEYHLGGETRFSGTDLNNTGGEYETSTLGVGTWYLIISRAGISNTGFVSLSQTLGPIIVSTHKEPPPPPPPPASPRNISAIERSRVFGKRLGVFTRCNCAYSRRGYKFNHHLFKHNCHNFKGNFQRFFDWCYLPASRRSLFFC